MDPTLRQTAVRRWPCAEPREDTSAIVGLQTPFAAIALAVNWIGCLTLGLLSGGVENLSLYLVVFAAIGVAYGVLLGGPGSPLARWATVAAVIADGVAAAAFVWAIVPDSRGALLPFAGSAAVVGALFCLRGRTMAGWVALSVITAILGVGGATRADPALYLTETVGGNLGVLAMMTLFAAIVGPRADQIFALRRQARRDSTALVVREIRDQEAARLEERVRPLLQRIADGEVFDEADLVECRLVAAQLRDRIRAPGLDVPAVAEAARQARRRDVRVVLLDDRVGARRPVGDELDEVHSAAVDTLTGAAAGTSVTVRLLPAGRRTSATISVAGDDGVVLRELDAVAPA